ncbi:MAG: hypothetical protein AMXMBFR61_03380 [Fimbriimonadales bacterium]
MRGRRGFTLVDVLIAVIIVGVLASVVIPKVQDAQVRARYAARAALINIYSRAAARYQTDTDLFPTSLDDLAATTPPPNGLLPSGVRVPLRAALWRGPYVSAVQNDPVTGQPFVYVTSGPAIGTTKAPPDLVPALGL